MPTRYFLPFITFKFILTSTHNYTTQWWSLIQSPPRSQLENWVELDEPARAELPFYFRQGASLFTVISLCRSCCHIDSLVKNQCKYCGFFLFGKETFNLFVQLQYLIVSRLDITLNADMIHILFETCHIDSLLETRYTHILACIFRCINTRPRLINAFTPFMPFYQLPQSLRRQLPNVPKITSVSAVTVNSHTGTQMDAYRSGLRNGPKSMAVHTIGHFLALRAANQMGANCSRIQTS